MRANIKYATPAGHAESAGFRHANLVTVRRGIRSGLAVLGILLVLSILPVGQSWAAGQAAQSNDDRIQKLDSRWLPWIGSWYLISNAVNKADGSVTSKNILEIKPGDNRNSVVMKGSQDEKVLYDEKNVIVDSARHPIKDDECEGWYEYSWSNSGKRLLFDSEVICSDNRLRTISGISAFTDPSEWVDIQLLMSGEDRMITIREYRQAIDGQNFPVAGRESHFARVAAGTNFSIEEIIELTGRVQPEVLEAALVEMRKPFEINSETIMHLSDAGVSPQVVDLMVAISYPDKFTIDRHYAEPEERPSPRQYGTAVIHPYAWSPFGMWSYYDPFFPWYWSSMYGYWGWGGYYTPIWGPPGSGGGYRISGGRLVEGQGYSRVYSGTPSQPRYAQPRGSSGTVSRGAGSGSSRSGSYSTGSSSGGSYSGGSSGGSSGGGSPSASPGGYSSGGGGGGTARPR